MGADAASLINDHGIHCNNLQTLGSNPTVSGCEKKRSMFSKHVGSREKESYFCLTML